LPGHAFEDQGAVAVPDQNTIPFDVLPLEQGERHRVLEPALDDPFERAGAVDWIIALVDQGGLGFGRHLQGEAAVRRQPRHTRDLQFDDLQKVVATERPEDDHIVHAVQKLRLEVLPQRFEDLHLGLVPLSLAELEDPLGTAATTLTTVAPEPLDELLAACASAPLTESERTRAETIDRPQREAVGRAELARARAELAATIAAVRAGRAHPRTASEAPPPDRADARAILIGSSRYVVLERDTSPSWWRSEEAVARERAARLERLEGFLRTIGKRRN